MIQRPLRFGALFAGYGGLEDGVQSVLDGALAWYSEYEPPAEKNPRPSQAAARIMAHHHPGVPNLGDITQIDWHKVAPVDVLTGGSPCQDASAAGKRVGMRAGTRSGLWASMCDAIETLEPKLVVWENVRGVLSSEADSAMEPCPGCVGDGDGRPALRALGRVLGDLAGLGYDAWWCGLRASDVGAPHARYRVFVFATPQDSNGAARFEWGGAAPGQAEVRRAWPDTGRRGRAPATAHTEDHRQPARDGFGSAPQQSGASRLATTPPDASRIGWDQRRPESAGIVLGLDAPERGSPPAPDAHSDAVRVESIAIAGGGSAPEPGRHGEAPADADDGGLTSLGRVDTGERDPDGRGREDPSRGDGEPTEWGPYAPAIDRWAAALGRPAPPPTELGPKGAPRLSSRFVEWLMGLPDGHVTGVPGISRNDQLKALGNGVVPAQAAEATRRWLNHCTNAHP